MILERIYEVDFMDTSYGFRPERSCHQALSKLGEIIATKRVNWISDADIKGLLKYREVARRLGLRWLRRRSHKGARWSWEKYTAYLKHHPLAVPGRITDLIALSRSV